ncbi:Alpha/Beta hydrolase protein [Xylariales sp. PMI_506]|nr:Alpha/Beta hydrolase protein [Xylariales sp. PMI_506]
MASHLTQRDLRQTSVWSEVTAFYKSYFEPCYGKLSDATNLSFPAPDPEAPNEIKSHNNILFTGVEWHEQDGYPQKRTQIYTTELNSGNINKVPCGAEHNCTHAKYKPGGHIFAFLSDRATKGVFAAYIFHVDSGKIECIPGQDALGSAEWLEWSADGARLLVGFAGLGADVGDAAGSGKVGTTSTSLPSWMPTVKDGYGEDEFRTLAIWDGGYSVPIEPVHLESKNIWEASWLGNDKIIALVSDAPDEGSWYHAPIALVDLKDRKLTTVTGLEDQHEMIKGSPSGKRFCCIQGLASDRGIIAGNIIWGDSATSSVSVLDVGADVTYITWRSDDHLFYMAFQGLSTVTGEVSFDGDKPTHKQVWKTDESPCGFPPIPQVAILPASESFVTVLQSGDRYAEIGTVQRAGEQSTYTTLSKLRHGGADFISNIIEKQEVLSWPSSDDLLIDGILQIPKAGKAPYPLILRVHGGPVASWRNSFPDNLEALLLSRGYAVLKPNPRGSSSRGQVYSKKIIGDMGGLEVDDHISGIQSLIKTGIADAEKVGVIGGSHGGFMASWIISRHPDMFKASVSLAAVNDWVSLHTTSNIPAFTSMFFKEGPYSMSADSLSLRNLSPITMAGRVKTPVLHIAGEDDACVPPSQALQFHNALREHGVQSVVAVYKGEGHGVRKFPAVIDAHSRILEWFDRFMR